MAELVEDLAKRLGRSVPEEEVLIWLALGAASMRDVGRVMGPAMARFRGTADGARVQGAVKAALGGPAA